MIYFDTTKAGDVRHRSGLTRVSARLLAEFGDTTCAVLWDGRWLERKTRRPIELKSDDWLLTPELFSPEERTGWSGFLEQRPCRIAAIFHDAIPLKLPHITWPQSVARHPAYMKMLGRFDRVWAVSQASRDELTGFWRWQAVNRPPPVDVLTLGSDSGAQPRTTAALPRSARLKSAPQLLCLGIIEPRKNQSFLLAVCEALWREGLAFELHIVGRVNPHFGAPIVRQIKTLQRESSARVHFHEAAADSAVAKLYHDARATVFPTIAEGCGLPLLESLWRGVPCVHSALPVLQENSTGGGCVSVAVNDLPAWKAALTRVLTDDAHHAQLSAEAMSRPLPTWADAAKTLRRGLDSP
jgi:glycosyltransferase involved in cell wall biosynthesis